MNHAGMTSQPRLGVSPGKSATDQAFTLFAADIAKFTRPYRDDSIRRHLHEALYKILKQAFEESGISWAACSREDRGDGILVVVPPGIVPTGIIDPLPRRLRDLIRRHNRASSDAVGIRLRAAAHIGPVDHDGRKFVGSNIDLLFRMLKAQPLKRALARPGADLALIVSDDMYHSLGDHYPGAASPEVFEPIRFQVKNTHAQAWAYRPGTASQNTRCDIDQAMTAFGIALVRMDANPGEAARIRNLADATDAQETAEARAASTGDTG